MILPTSFAVSMTTGGITHKLRRLLAVLTLGLLHFFALAYCEISAAFSDVFFPFRMTPEPEHMLWQSLTEVLRFPLVSLGNVAGLEDSPLMLAIAILNSAVWAVGIYLFSRWLVGALGLKQRAATP